MKAASSNVDMEGENSLGSGDNTTKNSHRHIVRNSILAGGMAGITSTVMFHPLDVIRTKIQSVSMSSLGTLPKAPTTAGAAGALKPCMGPMAVLSHTIKHGGYRSLYTGLSLPLGAQILYKATVFTINNITKEALVKLRTSHRDEERVQSYNLSLSDTFLCGALSGAINAFLFVTPIEFVRNQQIEQHTRAANKNNSPSSPSLPKNRASSLSAAGKARDVIYNTLQTHGISGLWRGAGVTVVRDGLGCGSFFVMFEIGKDFIAPLTSNGARDSFSVTLGAGALAGIGFWVAALPFDTTKTLIQTGKFDTFSETVLSSVTQDGVRKTIHRLFRGWQVALGRGAPAAAVTLGTYDFSFRFLKEL